MNLFYLFIDYSISIPFHSIPAPASHLLPYGTTTTMTFPTALFPSIYVFMRLSPLLLDFQIHELETPRSTTPCSLTLRTTASTEPRHFIHSFTRFIHSFTRLFSLWNRNSDSASAAKARSGVRSRFWTTRPLRRRCRGAPGWAGRN